nr:DUF4350 domain-containing protein [Bacteroides sp. 51]
MIVVEYSLPKKFVWNPTFSQYDHQPFGSAVFDDVVEASLASHSFGDTVPAYSVVDETLYQLSQDSITNYSVLVVVERLSLSETDSEALLRMLDRGNKVMLVASGFNKALRDTLGFDCSYSYFNFSSLKKYATALQGRDTIYWCKNSNYADEQMFMFYPHLCRADFSSSDSLFTRLSEKIWLETDSLGQEVEYSSPYAITRKVGAGEITLVSTPLIFTNYGMLDGNNSVYLFRLLNQLQGLPILRTEAYGVKRSRTEETPLRYLLSQRPLRWGLYLTMITLILFMIFTARRHQRPIPVIRKPANKTVEFVELIGTLYFQRKDHTDLVQKKFLYFAETLRRTIQVNVEDEEDDEKLARRMASKTGMNEREIFRMLVNIRPVLRGERKVGEETMRRLVDYMNKIINKLKIES